VIPKIQSELANVKNISQEAPEVINIKDDAHMHVMNNKYKM